MHLVNTLREVARHALYRAGMRPPKDHLTLPNRGDRFSAIYDRGLWRVGDTDPLSGPGSSVSVTAAVREGLPALLKSLETETLLDIGCGDLTWMKLVQLDRYIGVDIVPSVIEANKKALPQHDFLCLDAVTDELPDADTVLCREVLFHLSFADIKGLVDNLKRKNRRWLIATTEARTAFNADIATGDFRPLNLQKAPFRFGPPAMIINDDGWMADRQLAVWSVPTLEVA